MVTEPLRRRTRRHERGGNHGPAARFRQTGDQAQRPHEVRRPVRDSRRARLAYAN